MGVCETDNYCADILSKRFPGIPNYGNVRSIPVREIRKQGVDVITASPPCQPFSVNGKRLGAADERDCFPAVKRAIESIRPEFFIIENVPGLLSCRLKPGSQALYFQQFLRQITKLGYDAEWLCVCSGNFGAPFLRERLLLVGISRRLVINWENTTPWTEQVRNTIKEAGIITQRRGAKPGYPQRLVRYPQELARPLGVPSGNGTVRKQRQAAGNLLDPRVASVAVSRVQYLSTIAGVGDY
ncbi:DNA cytosine methyltransferase [Sphaerospermopsis sp. FACHB-1094]|uniref:DNA cytosine methyltransferase n=1 Tax=Sphaerospermopsis TaxID=752201 RepID=UPI000BBC7D6C|nr:DNA cytosine methyltransferase [Sphaerospermopsis sp. FACHB-1094]